MPDDIDKVATLEHSFTIQQITPRRVDQAYSLARLARPWLTLDAWRRLCANAAEDPSAVMAPSGVLLLIDKADYIRGLCRYRVESATAGEPRLFADMLVLVALFGREELLDRMMEALQRIAEAHGCRTIDMEERDAGECSLWHATEQSIPIRSVCRER